ncbi:MAG: nucleoside deaminase [Oscillospiraceae bacterium]|jgi:tRNA(adenine34) deaminase|nr:nucleoside deaminase [Oscillospiraceae bacterium]
MLLDEEMMFHALAEARLAGAAGDVPVGAVVERDGQVILRTRNEKQLRSLPTAHAELMAVEQTAMLLGTRYLSDCTIYVTLEPCPMCAGAIVAARFGRVVFGAYNIRCGALGSLFNLLEFGTDPKPLVRGGILESECALLLTEHFRKLRK